MLTFNSFGLSLVLGGFMVLSSCSSEPKSAVAQPSSMANVGSFATPKARISFKIKGTGSKGISVKIGVGSSVGYGSCCSTVSPFTTAGFSGNVGDLVYDGDTKRVIVKIYDDLEGTTVDLKDYY
ncbi:MAG: hypothetical protein FJZ80_01525 [Bacteroidetes bacterium]|nr:hypothetical protein [Bacteroidota bacterium]MBM3425320.1 hypothetical protein [Bacteroidota bacterium]